MKIHSKDFRVQDGDDVDLKKWPTAVNPVYKSKEQYQELLGTTSPALARNSNCSTRP